MPSGWPSPALPMVSTLPARATRIAVICNRVSGWRNTRRARIATMAGYRYSRSETRPAEARVRAVK